jgi:hypothetical protein
MDKSSPSSVPRAVRAPTSACRDKSASCLSSEMPSRPTLCRDRPHASAGMSPVPHPRRQLSIRACDMQARAGAGGAARSSRPDSALRSWSSSHSPRLQGATAAGQSQRAQGQSDQSQHEPRGATDYSVTGAGTTGGDSQIQPAIHRGD